MQIYCIRVAGGPDRSGTLVRAGGAEDVGGGRALIVGRSYPTSGQASIDQCGANISSLDNMGTKSPWPTISTGRMNDT